MSNKAENNGFSPKNWKYIDCDPEFGSLTNYSDTRFSDPAKEEFEVSGGLLITSLDTSYRTPVEIERITNELIDEEETEVYVDPMVGMVKFWFSQEGCDMVVYEHGLKLSYEKEGALSDATLEINRYCNRASDALLEKLGGDDLNEFLSIVESLNESLYICANIETSSLFVARVNRDTQKSSIVAYKNDLDLSKAIIGSFPYLGYEIFIGTQNEEDEFRLGFFVERNGGDGVDSMVSIMMLNNCNHQTFLNSNSPDRFVKLARRMLLL